MVIIFLLSFFFLFASSIKILGWQKKIFAIQLAMFIKYGLNRQIMMLIGFAELFGALTLLGTSIGAIFCHLIWDKWKDGIAAMITGSLSGFIVWTNRDIVPDFIDLSQLF